MQLAVVAAKANGKFDETEQEMLIKFANEMNIEPKSESNKSFDELVDELAKISSKKEKKIILFEAIGILNSDGEFDEKEAEYLANVAKKFDISKEDLEYMMSLVSYYIELFDEIVYTVVDEEE
ncbi:MAG: TerB family tellurite resistance protein [Lachnospiraceae bacterium]|nr:TerB family tellurite resistance protein [Lachnospiraceae bacterium]